MPLKVTQSSPNPAIELITLAGTLTLGRDSQGLEWTVEELIKSSRHNIIFDFSEVSFVDSAGIGIIVGCHGKASSAGGQLRLAGVNERVRNVLHITKVDTILNLDASVADSLSAIIA